MDINKLLARVNELNLYNNIVKINTEDGMTNIYYVDENGGVEEISSIGYDIVKKTDDLKNVVYKTNFMEVYVEETNEKYFLIMNPTLAQKQWPNVILDGDYIWSNTSYDLSNYVTMDDLASTTDGESTEISEVFDEDSKDFDLLLATGNAEFTLGTDTDDNVIKITLPDDNWVGSIKPGSKFYKYDKTSKYKISYKYLSKNAGEKMVFRVGLLGYDKDGQVLNNLAFSYHEKERFTLTQDYTAGDMVIYFDTTNYINKSMCNRYLLSFDKVLYDGTTLWTSPTGTIHKNYSRDIAVIDTANIYPDRIELTKPFDIDIEAGRELKQGLEYGNNTTTYLGMPMLPYIVDYNLDYGEDEWLYRETCTMGNKLLEHIPLFFHNTDKFTIHLNITGCDGLEIKDFKITKHKEEDYVTTMSYTGSGNTSQRLTDEGIEYTINKFSNKVVSSTDYITIDTDKLYESNFVVDYKLPDNWRISVTSIINSWNGRGHFLRTRENNHAIGRRAVLTSDLKKGDTTINVDDSSVFIAHNRDLVGIGYFHRQEDDFYFKADHLDNPMRFGYTEDKFEWTFNTSSLGDDSKIVMPKPYNGRDMKAGDTITQGAPNNGYYYYSGGASSIKGSAKNEQVNVGLFSGENDIINMTVPKLSVKRNGPVLRGFGSGAKYASFGLFIDSLYDENNVKQPSLPDGYYFRVKKIKFGESNNTSCYTNLLSTETLSDRISLNFDKTKPVHESRSGVTYKEDKRISDKEYVELVNGGKYFFPKDKFIINPDSIYKVKLKVLSEGPNIGTTTYIRFQQFDKYGNTLSMAYTGNPDSRAITLLEPFDITSTRVEFDIHTDGEFVGTKMVIFPKTTEGDFRFELSEGIITGEDFSTGVAYLIKISDSVEESTGVWKTRVKNMRFNRRVEAGSVLKVYPTGSSWLLGAGLITTNGEWHDLETPYVCGITPANSNIYKDGTGFISNAFYARPEILTNYKDKDGVSRLGFDNKVLVKDIELIEIKPGHKDYDTIKANL